MKRILALLIVVILAVGLFGCGGGKETNTSDTVSTTPGLTDDIFSVDNVNFFDADGESVYRIVRPDGDSKASTAASVVFKKVKDVLGIKMKNVADTEDGTDKYEILIGNTNRPESSQALQYLIDNGNGRYNDYIICTIGKKIVINGITEEGLTAAAEYFVNNYVKNEGVAGGIKYVYAMSGDFTAISINGISISKFHLVRDNTSRSWLIQNEIEQMLANVKDKSGFIVNLEEDTETEEYECEISIGNTNRPGVKDESGYNRDEYEILISGKKVYLLGGSTYAVQVAVTEFAAMIEQKSTLTDADSKTGSYSQTIKGYDSRTYYRLVWGDEFDGNALDETKWIIRDATNSGSVGPVNLVKNEYTFAVTGGNLIFRAFPNDQGGYDHCDAIKSDLSMSYNMGYLEMRARIPDGKGVYSSFWTVGSGGQAGSLEIDIMESLGNAGLQKANIHKWKPEADGGHTSLDGTDAKRDYRLEKGTLFDQYRTISLLWTYDEVRFFYDGQEYYSQATDEYFIDKYLYVIAGFNVGWKDRVPPADGMEWPLEYHIDYIRLYQVDGQTFRE